MAETPVWNKERLEALISDRVPESVNLDYKASAALAASDGKKKELSRDISAFANSEGGTLIYGVTENDLHLPESIDGGVDPSVISAEWLDEVIKTTIHPRVEVHISSIEVGGAPARCCYVVEIAKGTTSHMASDKHYWKRFNTTKAQMEDYEVKDVQRREEVPRLVTSIEIERDHVAYREDRYSDPLELVVRVKNLSVTPTDYAIFYLGLDNRLRIQEIGEFSEVGEQPMTAGGRSWNVKKYQANWHIAQKTPIFQEVGDQRLGFRVSAPYPSVRIPASRTASDQYLVFLSVTAPRMKTHECFYLLTAQDGDVSIGQVESN